MFERTCYDESGKIIDYLWQWDVNRTIGIDLNSITVDDPIEVRFSNKIIEDSKSSYATLIDGIVYVTIPNEFLMYNCILYIYICSKTSSTKKTIAYVELPVREMKKPDNYESHEDKLIEVATREEVKEYLGID